MEDQKTGKLIAKSKYQWLKNWKHLTLKEQEEIEQYEKAQRPSREQVEKNVRYAKKIHATSDEVNYSPDSKSLLEAFKKCFEETYNKPFIERKEAIDNLNCVAFYLSEDERFFECTALSKMSKPSFEKGLLIVGSYGSGKTSTMKIFHKLFCQPRFFKTPLTFGWYSAQEVVEQYENIQTPADKTLFWNNMVKGTRYFDDVKTERQASNYGKVNLFKEIIEKRYDLYINTGKKTYLSCNYAKGKENVGNLSNLNFGS